MTFPAIFVSEKRDPRPRAAGAARLLLSTQRTKCATAARFFSPLFLKRKSPPPLTKTPDFHII